MSKINRYYVSEIDKKMAEFNRSHKRSKSQQQEYDKYQAIYAKRDQTSINTDSDDINWD
jgi:hypothetical protein